RERKTPKTRRAKSNDPFAIPVLPTFPSVARIYKITAQATMKDECPQDTENVTLSRPRTHGFAGRSFRDVDLARVVSRCHPTLRYRRAGGFQADLLPPRRGRPPAVFPERPDGVRRGRRTNRKRFPGIAGAKTDS